MKVINKRILLEKKYCNICLYNKFPLEQNGNRILSVSPSNFYYHTGINANGLDVKNYKILSEKSHFGERLRIENEVKNIIDYEKIFYNSTWDMKYFFEVKNTVINWTIERLNRTLIKNNMKPLRKNKFNRLKRLFRKWTMESVPCHYKITGAKKRLHKKYYKEMRKENI